MSTLIKSVLLATVISLLSFLGFQATKSATQHIHYTKSITELSNTDNALQNRVDKLLESLTAGLYDKYSNQQSQVQALENKAYEAQQKSLSLIYYFFGTIILFIILFFIIDKEFLVLFIGASALVTLIYGLTAPLLMIIVYKSLPVVGMVTLSFETKTIITTIQKLFDAQNYFIALLVMLFSIILPLMKTTMILLYGFLKESGLGKNLITIMDKLGKWSMADVFIVAFLVVFFSTKQDIHSALKINLGLYFFIGYVLLSMIGSSLIGKKG
ncbi:MAG: paraquat-inducible protein A [Epsilonproteobacteria bacterium]|nr:paraquat-inducible protein A [Campylobacterota bacterium]